MKRRIIAALTALVMVVTMIPASAFAAEKTADAVNDIIKAIGLEDGKFDYKDKQYVLEAHNIFVTLDKEEQDKVDKSAELEDAVNAITVFEKTVAGFKTDMTKVTADSLTADGAHTKIMQDEFNNAVTAYNAIVAGKIKGEAKVATVNAIVDKKELASLLGDANVEIMSNLPANLDNFIDFVYNVNYIDSFTDKEIAEVDIDKLPSDLALHYNAAVGRTYENGDYYLFLAKGYDKFKTLDARINADSVVQNKINDIKKLIGTGSDKNGALKVAEIKAKEATEDAIKNLEKGLADAKALIEKTPNISDIDSTFVDYYKLTQKAYDRYLTRDAVEATVKQLPVKVANAKTYAEVVAVYNEFSAIDVDVVRILDKAVQDLYDNAEKNLKAKLAAFNENTIIADYAAKVDAQIAVIPTIPSRADIAKIDAVIDTLMEYDAVVAAAGKGTASNAVKSDKLTEKDVFALAKVSKSLTVGSLAGKLSKGALDKFNAAYAYMATLANADVEAITKVAGYVSDAKGAIPKGLTTITNDASKEKAEKAIADYKAGYAALTEIQKADFDKAAKDKTAHKQFYCVKENIEKIEEALAAYASTEDKVLAGEIARNIRDFVKVFDRTEAKENTVYYNAQKAAINALDASMSKASVKAEVEKLATADKSVAPNVWTAYNDVKEYMDELVAESYAPTAVINAIAALKVINPEKETVTKEVVDGTIVSYEAADKAYKALTPAEQAKVTNYAKLAEVRKGIVEGITAIIKAEIAKIGTFDETNKIPLTDAQKATVNGITVMKDQYKTYVDADGFAAIDKATSNKYTKAVANMKAEITSAAGKEFADVQPTLQDVLAKYYVGANYKVDKTSALALINAIDKYNALSDEAKKYAKGDNPTKTNYYATYQIDKLAVAADFAKTLVLDYATVEVADVEFDGTPATPAVVVKDFHGNAIDAKEFTVSYSNNEKPGTAKVIVTAKEDGKYVGTVTKEFKVIAKELAKVTGVKADTDYGIIRVYFDRNADVEGIDVRYQVQYTRNGKTVTKYPTKGLDYLTLKGLVKNGKYAVKVRAYTDDYGTERVYGEWSDVKNVYANRNGAQSGTMYKAVINKLTTKNGSVTVTVKGVKYQTVPQGVTWKYSFKKYGSQYKTWSTAKTTKSTSYTFKNLKKGTRYVFRAQYTYNTAVDGKTAVNSNYSVYKNIVVK